MADDSKSNPSGKISHNENIKTMTKDDEAFIDIGGGAINEKKRTFQGQDHSSLNAQAEAEETIQSSSNSGRRRVYQGSTNQGHFLHAMEGLDRYPNYLSRWTSEDSEELEKALLQRLETVRAQRKEVESQQEGLKAIIEKVCEAEPEWQSMLKPPATWQKLQESGILDENASRAIFRSKYFRKSSNHTVPTLQEVLWGNARVELDAGYLQEIMEEEVFDVYSFPLLSESFCDRLQRYMQRITEELHKSEDAQFAARGQRSVRKLESLGLGWVNDLLFELVTRPISRHLYSKTEMGGEGSDLDWRHAFIAAYSADPDVHKPRQHLVPHTDDAEVTLNVCLGDVFVGGNLQFWGLRGTDEAGELLGEYVPEKGRALLHAGRQLHEVTEITDGDRFALIMWARSWGGIRRSTCPCCWLNRRTHIGQSSCICAARWN